MSKRLDDDEIIGIDEVWDPIPGRQIGDRFTEHGLTFEVYAIRDDGVVSSRVVQPWHAAPTTTPAMTTPGLDQAPRSDAQRERLARTQTEPEPPC